MYCMQCWNGYCITPRPKITTDRCKQGKTASNADQSGLFGTRARAKRSGQDDIFFLHFDVMHCRWLQCWHRYCITPRPKMTGDRSKQGKTASNADQSGLFGTRARIKRSSKKDVFFLQKISHCFRRSNRSIELWFQVCERYERPSLICWIPSVINTEDKHQAVLKQHRADIKMLFETVVFIIVLLCAFLLRILCLQYSEVCVSENIVMDCMQNTQFWTK